MTFPLLYIRYKQLQRQLQGFSLYLFIFFGLIFLLVYISFLQFQKQQNAYHVVVLLVIISVLLQFYRKDKPFIYRHIDKPHLQIFFEYVALTLPFSITCLITKNWYCYPLLLLLLFCIPLFKFQFRQKTVFKNLSFIIPSSSFEWISGFRKKYFTFIGIYTLSVAFCWFKILPLFLLWFLSLLIISFHDECESIQILREGNKSPHNFLLEKLYTNSTYLIILYLPLITINTIFNSDFLLINAFFVPTQIALLCFAICLKYSTYSPGKKPAANNIPLAIVAFASSLPYLLPIPALLAIVYFYIAKKNLKKYLND